MSIIFFNAPVGTPKVQFVNTDKSVAELVEADVIPANAATLVQPEPSTDEGLAMLSHVDKLVFDSLENPTAVLFDMELVDMFWKDVYRECRAVIMKQLDVLQQRALVKGATDVVAQIEADKQSLRDIPASVDYATYPSFAATAEHNPVELFTDYEAKYSAALA